MTKGKAHGRNSQGFKPDLGNSAVRHYRGASENVAMVEMRSQLAIERAGLVTPHLQPARRSSIPTKSRPPGPSPSESPASSTALPVPRVGVILTSRLAH